MKECIDIKEKTIQAIIKLADSKQDKQIRNISIRTLVESIYIDGRIDKTIEMIKD